MRSGEYIKRLIENAKIKINPEIKQAALSELVKELEKDTKNNSAQIEPDTGRIIMNSKIMKLAAAASFCIIFLLINVFFEQFTKPAYAIEQTIQVNEKIQTFHFKLYAQSDPNNKIQCTREAWVEYDKDGNISKVRVNYYNSHSEKNIIQIWKDGKALDWSIDSNRLFIIEDKLFSDKILRFGEKYNPRGALQFLHERQAIDKIKIEIKEPPDKTQPITITADYPPNTYLLGKDMPAMRDVYFVDQNTKLITSVEIYQSHDDIYANAGIWRYEDYNQPFDDALFSIEDKLPENIIKLYLFGEKNAGLKQGDLEEKEIAAELTKEFLNALIDKDYAKVGHLFGGMPNNQVEKNFGTLNIVQIISINEPVQILDCYKVSCSLGINNNGHVLELKPKDLYIRKANNQEDYWIIVGGIN